MFAPPPVNNHYPSSSESGDSLSDSFLDAEVAQGAINNLNGPIMARGLGPGSPNYLSAFDQDVALFDRPNDPTIREMFISQPYDDQALVPRVDYFQPERHSPTQFRTRSLHLGSGDAQYTSRPKHHIQTTMPLLPQLITENLDFAADTPTVMDSNTGCAPEPNSTTTTSSCGNSPHRESKQWSSEATQDDHPPRVRKARREKPRIQLAPDQPPTTQGKARSRVYVACVQCRTRKIRCDGAKPTCHNCGRRTTSGGDTCSYDSAPKRRGPDKTPGARQRTARGSSQEGDVNGVAVRRRRWKREPPSSSKSGDQVTSGQRVADNYAHQSPVDMLSPVLPVIPISPLSEELSETWDSLVPVRRFAAPQTARLTAGNGKEAFNLHRDYHESSFKFIGDLTRGYADRGFNHQERKVFNIVAEPSLDFTRKTWWDSLLTIYSSSLVLDPLAVTSTQRENAASHITSDLRFLFRASNYWFFFFHIPRFFSTFFDPSARDRMQPSLILAACALATFWQSSEIGKGKPGRNLALRLRDEAEGALQASLNAGWIDEALAQAAWILAMFEICAHPLHSSLRSASSMVILDQIIRTLSLTFLDADDPNVSVFSRREVPRIPPEQKPVQQTSWNASSRSIDDSIAFCDPAITPGSEGSHLHRKSSPKPIIRTENCKCAIMSLGHRWASAFEHTPQWLSTPAWDENWSDGEIKKESCRRLCWSTVSLAAGHSSYTTAYKANGLDLFITEPANYRLLFPGETLTPSHYCKDSIWALNYRTMLLWHACARMRHDVHATDAEKACFGMDAWLEVDALEKSLDNHSCGLERAFLFQGREYLFNTRVCISYEFQRYIPPATANVSGLFHRKKAEEWLTHQATIAKQVMHGLHTVTGQGGSGSLIQRPFFVFWFMSQISRALSLWDHDKSLRVALEVSAALLAPIDYLTALWPCPEQRIRYERLREQLDQACIFAGLPVPDPLNLTLPATTASALSIPTCASSTPPPVASPWGQNYEPTYVQTTDTA